MAEVILATSGYDHTIRFWEALSGICIRTIQHPDSQVNKLAISPDKRFLAAAGNPGIRLYEIQTANPNPITSFSGHTGNVTAIAFQSNGRWIASASEDGTIKIWDTRAPNVQRDYELKVPVTDVIIHPNQGELVSCDASGSIRIWDLGENVCSHEMTPEEDVVARSVTMSADGCMLVAANNKGNVYSWTNRLVNNASSSSAAAQRGSSLSSNPISESGGGVANTSSLTTSSNVNTNNGSSSDWLELCTLKAHSKYITKCLLSPDTRLLATCSADHTVKLWDTTQALLDSVALSDPHSSSHRSHGIPPHLQYNNNNTTFSASSSSTSTGGSGFAAAATTTSASTTKTPQFVLDKTISGHQRWVWDCSFSADSAYLVTASSDHSARLWDLSTGESIRHYVGHQKAIVCIALHDISL